MISKKYIDTPFTRSEDPVDLMAQTFGPERVYVNEAIWDSLTECFQGFLIPDFCYVAANYVDVPHAIGLLQSYSTPSEALIALKNDFLKWEKGKLSQFMIPTDNTTHHMHQYEIIMNNLQREHKEEAETNPDSIVTSFYMSMGFFLYDYYHDFKNRRFVTDFLLKLERDICERQDSDEYSLILSKLIPSLDFLGFLSSSVFLKNIITINNFEGAMNSLRSEIRLFLIVYLLKFLIQADIRSSQILFEDDIKKYLLDLLKNNEYMDKHGVTEDSYIVGLMIYLLLFQSPEEFRLLDPAITDRALTLGLNEIVKKAPQAKEFLIPGSEAKVRLTKRKIDGLAQLTTEAYAAFYSFCAYRFSSHKECIVLNTDLKKKMEETAFSRCALNFAELSVLYRAAYCRAYPDTATSPTYEPASDYPTHNKTFDFLHRTSSFIRAHTTMEPASLIKENPVECIRQMLRAHADNPAMIVRIIAAFSNKYGLAEDAIAQEFKNVLLNFKHTKKISNKHLLSLAYFIHNESLPWIFKRVILDKFAEKQNYPDNFVVHCFRVTHTPSYDKTLGLVKAAVYAKKDFSKYTVAEQNFCIVMFATNDNEKIQSLIDKSHGIIYAMYKDLLKLDEEREALAEDISLDIAPDPDRTAAEAKVAIVAKHLDMSCPGQAELDTNAAAIEADKTSKRPSQNLYFKRSTLLKNASDYYFEKWGKVQEFADTLPDDYVATIHEQSACQTQIGTSDISLIRARLEECATRCEALHYDYATQSVTAKQQGSLIGHAKLAYVPKDVAIVPTYTVTKDAVEPSSVRTYRDVVVRYSQIRTRSSFEEQTKALQLLEKYQEAYKVQLARGVLQGLPLTTLQPIPGHPISGLFRQFKTEHTGASFKMTLIISEDAALDFVVNQEGGIYIEGLTETELNSETLRAIHKLGLALQLTAGDISLMKKNGIYRPILSLAGEDDQREILELAPEYLKKNGLSILDADVAVNLDTDKKLLLRHFEKKNGGLCLISEADMKNRKDAGTDENTFRFAFVKAHLAPMVPGKAPGKAEIKEYVQRVYFNNEPLDDETFEDFILEFLNGKYPDEKLLKPWTQNLNGLGVYFGCKGFYLTTTNEKLFSYVRRVHFPEDNATVDNDMIIARIEEIKAALGNNTILDQNLILTTENETKENDFGVCFGHVYYDHTQIVSAAETLVFSQPVKKYVKLAPTKKNGNGHQD